MSSMKNSEYSNDYRHDMAYDPVDKTNDKKGTKGPKRKHWLKEEDEAIVKLIQEFGTTKWTLISQMMKKKYNIGRRSAKQCRERWHNHLDPDIKKDPISTEEEIQIFKLHRKYGNKWAQISNEIPGRTDNAIKNQFHSILRRQVKKINMLLFSRKFQELYSHLPEEKKLREVTIEDLSKLLKDGLMNYDDINMLFKESLEGIDQEMVNTFKQTVSSSLEQK